MNLLQRYILREYTKILLISLSLLVITYLAIDFFEKVRRFAEHDPPLQAVVLFFALKLPRILYEMMPLALLLTTVLTLGYFSRTNETTAIRAGGINLVKVLAPLLGLGLTLGFILLLSNWSLIPSANRQSGLVKQIQIEKKERMAYFRQERVWLRLDSRSFFNAQVIEPSRKVMHEISLYRLTPDFSIKEILEAKEIRYQDGAWIALDGIVRTFRPDHTLETTRFERQTVFLNRTPDDFQGAVPEEEELSVSEINRYRQKLKQGGLDAAKYEMELAVRTAVPFAGLIMVLVGIPFGLQDRARAGLAKGIGLCLALALAYWVVLSLSISLGKSGVLPPLLAAWLANLTFLAVGFYFFLKIRQ